MSYELRFHADARKEWDKLDATVREQFKKKLKERLQNPSVDAARISGGCDIYKIKLRTLGYRLVYQVHNQAVVVLVLSVGKRERNFVYKTGLGRL
jgi:mRNA interferase RelE/StbE